MWTTLRVAAQAHGRDDDESHPGSLTHLTGLIPADPRTGLPARPFNPRTDNWDEHFEIDVLLAEIRGLTPIGRATADRLRMNSEQQRRARRLWILLFSFPDDPSTDADQDGE